MNRLGQHLPGRGINWDALANASYQVQCVPYVDATNWTNLGAPVTATGTNLSVFDATRGL